LAQTGGPIQAAQTGDNFRATVTATADTKRAADQGESRMTRRCELMGTLPLSGQRKSHAENKTKRKFRPNLCNVTLMSESLGTKLRLRVTARALKTVEHRGGLDAYLLKAKNEQLSPDCLKLKRELQKAAAKAKAA
jgi:large subunit ribosomal protein L28